MLSNNVHATMLRARNGIPRMSMAVQQQYVVERLQQGLYQPREPLGNNNSGSVKRRISSSSGSIRSDTSKSQRNRVTVPVTGTDRRDMVENQHNSDRRWLSSSSPFSTASALQTSPAEEEIQLSPSPSVIEAAKENKQKSTEEKKPRNRTNPKKDPIILTDRAIARIRELLAGENAVEMGAIGLKLGVKRRGCNGLSYTLNYATVDNQNAKDIAVVSTAASSDDKITVYIEPMALFSVVGTTMDFVETDMGSEFTFENPNSKGSCGCGESFNV